MKLCQRHGHGVCYRCDHKPPKNCGDICRYDAEELLECLLAIIYTEWTPEQAEIFASFEITKDDTE